MKRAATCGPWFICCTAISDATAAKKPNPCSRAALSPDGLTGLESNLRFGGIETMETRVFGRLSAWQNWIFVRPNAVGPNGALKVYGTGAPVKFNWERV